MELMHTHMPSWQIRADFPLALQFVGYVGRKVADLSTSHKDAWVIWSVQIMTHAARMNAPSFPEIDPLLRAMCQEEWPRFQEWWSIERKRQYTSQIHQQMQALNVNEIVGAHEQIKPFIMRIDFMIWPDGMKRTLSDSELTLGIKYLQEENLPLLRTIIEEKVAKLS